MAVNNVVVLRDGSFGADMGIILYMSVKNYGTPYHALLKPLLIETDDGPILVDTGIGNPPEEVAKYYNLDHGEDGKDTLLNSLAEAGYEPKDIRMVINTHLHVDHASNNPLFPLAKFYVQEEEIRYAHWPDRFQKSGYMKSSFTNCRFVGLDGEADIVDGVSVIPTPGHTPGHQSVIIKWGERTIVYCGDVAPTKTNLERDIIVGVLHDPVAALRSLRKIKKIGDEFIFSHDSEFIGPTKL